MPKSRFTDEEKKAILKAWKKGDAEEKQALLEEHGISRPTIYNWHKSFKKDGEQTGEEAPKATKPKTRTRKAATKLTGGKGTKIILTIEVV